MQSQETHAAARTSESESFHPAELLRIVRKNLALIAAVWVAVVAATTFWTLGQPRIYRATTLLRFDADPPRPLGQKVELLTSNTSVYFRKEFYETEFRVITSTRVTMAVVRQLGLHADPDFLGVPPKNRGNFHPIPLEDAAALLASRLNVEPIRDSSLAYVHYEDTDLRRAQTVLNTLTRIYLAQNLENASTISTSASEWLNGQLDTLKDALEKSETALSDFRSEHKVLTVSLDDKANMTIGQLETLTKGRMELEVRRIELAARVHELSEIKGVDPSETGSTELISNILLGTLRGNYVDEERALEELRATMGDDHPKVLALKQKHEATKNAIIREITNVKEALGRDLAAVSRQIADIKAKEDEVTKQASDLQTLSAPFNQLVRKKANNEKLYSLVLERARETDLTRMMNFNNIRVVEEASLPKVPVRPMTRRNVMVGAGLGLLLGAALAFAREKADRSLKGRSDVEELGAPFLGLVPDGGGPARPAKSATPALDLTVANEPHGQVAEALRSIRTNISFRSPDKPYRTLVVSSALPSEGKTTTACSLAISFAQAGNRVLLVDTDLRRPRIHRAFGLSGDMGLSIHLTGQVSLDECIQSTEIENLSVLPAGPVPPVPAELIQSERFRSVLAELEKRFDRVIFDSPPILPVTDAAILSQRVDGVVLVARGHRTPRNVVAQGLRRFLDVNASIVGLILNAVDVRRHGYGSTYYYSGKYYSEREDTGASQT